MPEAVPPISTMTPLSPLDIVIFALVLIVAVSSGVYQGCCETFRKKKDVVSQRRGSKVEEVSVVPPGRRNSLGMALLTSTDGGSIFKDILFVLTCCMSVCLTSAVPISVYESGMSFAVMSIPAILSAHIISLVIVAPVFRPQETVSTFEDNPDHNGNSHLKNRTQPPRLHNYLRLRFKSSVLTCFAVFLVFLTWVVITCVVLYIVASIFHQMLNISMSLSIIVTIIVSTLFTAAEGKSRLLWTDVVWSVSIFTGLVVIFIFALVETGGYRDLLDKARQNIITGYENSELNISSFPPQTLTSVYFGQLLIWICIYCGFHSADSRFGNGSPTRGNKAAGTKSNRYGVVVFNIPFVIILYYILLSVGLAIVAAPKSVMCHIGSPGQTFSQFLAGRLSQHNNLVGFTGFFLSCQVAHSLSIASTGFYSLINKMANASAENTGVQVSPKFKNISIRILASLSTLFSGCLIFIISGSSPLQTLLTGISSMLGILFALHILGLFFPFATSRGVFLSGLLSFVACLCIAISSFSNSPGIGRLPFTPYRAMCNSTNVGLTYAGRFKTSFDASENYQMPSQTAAAAAGASAWLTPAPVTDEPIQPPDLAGPSVESETNQMEESPSHIIVSGRPKSRQSGHKQVSSASLPRSPVSSLTLDQALNGVRASTQQLSSPSLMIQQQQQLQQQYQQQQQQQQQQQSGIIDQIGSPQQKHPFVAGGGNKPPLILARPEDGSGDSMDIEKYNDNTLNDAPHYKYSFHLIGVAAFLITLLLGLTFSMMTIGDGPFPIDPLLFHPIVRSLCCCQNFLESTEARTEKNGEDVAKMLNKVALERRKSMMIASIEEHNGLDRHGSVAGSFTGELLRPIDGSDPVSLSRRCSRHSRRSQRSSLGSSGQPGGAQVSTTAEVLVVPSDAINGNETSKDIQRKLSQLSDDEVTAVAAMSINELTRRNSNPPLSTPTLLQRQILNQRGGSFRHTSTTSANLSGQRSPRSPRFLDANGMGSPSTNKFFHGQSQHLVVPPPAGHPYQRAAGHSPPQPVPLHLAPPTAEDLAQRRFSEVDAAIERHNSRRQAKRSQSVMYRGGQPGGPRRSRSKRSSADGHSAELDLALPTRRMSRANLNL